MARPRTYRAEAIVLKRIDFGEAGLKRRLLKIGESLHHVFEVAQARGVSTHEAADQIAEERLRSGRESHRRAPLPRLRPPHSRAHEIYFSRLGQFAPDLLMWCERFRIVEVIERT